MTMPERRDVVCISSIDWDFIWQGHQEIMATLAAQGHRVLFYSRLMYTERGWLNGVLATLLLSMAGDKVIDVAEVDEMTGTFTSSRLRPTSSIPSCQRLEVGVARMRGTPTRNRSTPPNPQASRSSSKVVRMVGVMLPAFGAAS
jgi:hypothetical protein